MVLSIKLATGFCSLFQSQKLSIMVALALSTDGIKTTVEFFTSSHNTLNKMFSSPNSWRIGEGVYTLLGAFNARNKTDYLASTSMLSTVAGRTVENLSIFDSFGSY
jgi:hypothetical protein